MNPVLDVCSPYMSCHAASGALCAVAGGHCIGSQPDHMGGGTHGGVCDSITVLLLARQRKGLGAARHLGRWARPQTLPSFHIKPPSPVLLCDDLWDVE